MLRDLLLTTEERDLFIEAQPPLLENGGESARFISCHRFRNSLLSNHQNGVSTHCTDANTYELVLFIRMQAAADLIRHDKQSTQSAGLGVNAGHDLNLQNLGTFCQIPGVLEVSIAHALVADAIEMGLSNAVRAYLTVLRSDFSQQVS